jgi:hypothetical protein
MIAVLSCPPSLLRAGWVLELESSGILVQVLDSACLPPCRSFACSTAVLNFLSAGWVRELVFLRHPGPPDTCVLLTHYTAASYRVQAGCASWSPLVSWSS